MERFAAGILRQGLQLESLAGSVQVDERDLQFLHVLAVLQEGAGLCRMHEGDDGQGNAPCKQALAEKVLMDFCCFGSAACGDFGGAGGRHHGQAAEFELPVLEEALPDAAARDGDEQAALARGRELGEQGGAEQGQGIDACQLDFGSAQGGEPGFESLRARQGGQQEFFVAAAGFLAAVRQGRRQRQAEEVLAQLAR